MRYCVRFHADAVFRLWSPFHWPSARRQPTLWVWDHGAD